MERRDGNPRGRSGMMLARLLRDERRASDPRNLMPTRLRWLLPLGLLNLSLAGLLALPGGFAAEKGDDPKEALQELQDLIGSWKGSAEKGKTQSNNETADWSWRFKGKDVSMSVEMPE